MIESEYYRNYRGPNLTHAQIWNNEEEKLDITEYMKEFYGYQNNAYIHSSIRKMSHIFYVVKI